MYVVKCVKLKKTAEGLREPPLPGQLGKKIYEQVSKEAWHLWLNHQTMLINEYRLSMIDLESRNFLLQEMDNFFFGTGSATPPGFVDK